MYKKLKSYMGNDAIFMAGMLICVGISSFGLGRLSTSSTKPGLVNLPQVALIASSLPSMQAATTTPMMPVVPAVMAVSENVASYVGSKSGTKYHLVTCPGAKRIKPENKIYFKTPTEAEAAGYSKASNCPGL